MTDYVSVWEYTYQYLWLIMLLVFALLGFLLKLMFRECSGFVEADSPVETEAHNSARI